MKTNYTEPKINVSVFDKENVVMLSAVTEKNYFEGTIAYKDLTSDTVLTFK